MFLDLVGLDALCACLHALDALGGLYPYLLKVRKPDLLGLILGMGNVMSCL